jgi:hypothetical protein
MSTGSEQAPNSPVVIPLDKAKVIPLLLGGVAFVGAGFWMWNLGGFLGGFLAKIIGVASIAVFGTFVLVGLLKMFDRGPGLVVDETGFTDNSSLFPFGRVEWSDVIGFQLGPGYIVVGVVNPDKYVSRLAPPAALVMRMIPSPSGSPINIATVFLPIGLMELAELFAYFYGKSRDV